MGVGPNPKRRSSRAEASTGLDASRVLRSNDTEADCPAQDLIDWDFKITREDKEMIESTDPYTPVDLSRRIEAHMVSDRPGMIMRRRLMKLLEENGEAEVFAPRNAGSRVSAIAAE